MIPVRIFFVFALIVPSFLTQSQSIPSWVIERFDKISNEYSIADYVSPEFLESDFSGDENSDVALLIERKKDKKKGILILFGGDGGSFIIGSGTNFGNCGDDFQWVKKWGIFNKSTALMSTFKENGDADNGKEVKLQRRGYYNKR